MSQFRAALVQMRSARTVEPNIVAAEALIREAAAAGAIYIQTPENTNILEPDPVALAAAITDEPYDPTLKRLTALAAELKIWLHIGSLAVRQSDSKAANRAFLIGPDGEIAARYDKIHLFDVDLANGERFRESDRVRPGAEAVVHATPFGVLGLSICYDMRFPHLYRTLTKSGGAEILTAPAAFTKTTGEAHWHVLLRARAIENGAFMLAAAQGGTHETGRQTYGHSIIIDPWGRVLAEAGTEPGIIVADIDTDEVAQVRGRIPALHHDRPFRSPDLAAAEARGAAE
jgi:predicted amidohydrolase